MGGRLTGTRTRTRTEDDCSGSGQAGRREVGRPRGRPPGSKNKPKPRVVTDEDTDQLVDALSMADTPTFEMIGDAMRDEVWRRLKDPIAVKDMAATQLMRSFQEYMKISRARDPEPEREVFQTPDLILEANLPRERKHELLLAQAEKAARAIRDCEEAIRRLNQ